MINKYVISRDDSIYEAWPDLVLMPSGKMICVFSECTHHNDRSFTRIMLTFSEDKGRTWSTKYALTEGTKGLPYFNSARIVHLKSGRYVVIVDKIHKNNEKGGEIILFFSDDECKTWSDPIDTPAYGIVPDKLLELECGRLIISCHEKDIESGYLVQNLWYSDDQGINWSGPVIVGKQEGLNLCEVSILNVSDQTLVAFMRENSMQGWDCFKSISNDNGETWSDLTKFPLPGCHRPVSGWLQNNQIMITYRFIQGGKRGFFGGHQNFFAAITDKDSVLSSSRDECFTRILPIDFDRSPVSDTGYSGWVQFNDGEIYIANYIVDDAPKGQIRGYSLTMNDFLI